MRKGKWKDREIRVCFSGEIGLMIIMIDFIQKTVKIKGLGLVGDDDFSIIPYRERRRSGRLHYRKTVWLSLGWMGLTIGRLRPTERTTKLRDRHGRCYVFIPVREKRRSTEKHR